jgi:SAM-dependent methyltransferase
MSPPDPRKFSPAAARNREPLLAVLRRVLPPRGLVLEIASGSGEHTAHFAAALPALEFQPSDRDASLFASIVAHAVAAAVANVLPPLSLDATAPAWPVARADAVLCINMIHISPWRASEGLMAGARRILAPGGALYLYGPYKRNGRHTADSNAEFDAALRAQNPDWGVRDLADVTALAARHGLALAETVAMPANNLSVVFRAI